MFFVQGLSSNGKEVYVNPDQVLYVRPARLRRSRSALVLTHSRRLIVDQNTETVRQRFEDYLKNVDTNTVDDSDAGECAESCPGRYLT
jgi:hypothetical protein